VTGATSCWNISMTPKYWKSPRPMLVRIQKRHRNEEELLYLEPRLARTSRASRSPERGHLDEHRRIVRPGLSREHYRREDNEHEDQQVDGKCPCLFLRMLRRCLR